MWHVTTHRGVWFFFLFHFFHDPSFFWVIWKKLKYFFIFYPDGSDLTQTTNERNDIYYQQLLDCYCCCYYSRRIGCGRNEEDSCSWIQAYAWSAHGKMWQTQIRDMCYVWCRSWWPRRLHVWPSCSWWIRVDVSRMQRLLQQEWLRQLRIWTVLKCCLVVYDVMCCDVMCDVMCDDMLCYVTQKQKQKIMCDVCVWWCVFFLWFV